MPLWHALTAPNGILYWHNSGTEESCGTTALFSSPCDTTWVYWDRNMYSHIQPQHHAGTQCSLGIASMCPHTLASYSVGKRISLQHKHEVPAPQGTGYIDSWSISNYYSVEQAVSLALHWSIMPRSLIRTHKYATENLTWQVNLLSN